MLSRTRKEAQEAQCPKEKKRQGRWEKVDMGQREALQKVGSHQLDRRGIVAAKGCQTS